MPSNKAQEDLIYQGRIARRKVEFIVGLLVDRPIDEQDEFSLIKLDDRYRITFDIDYSIDTSLPSWKVEVYNLSDDTVNLIDKRGLRYQLYAGYNNDFSIIAQGNIRKIWNRWEAPNRITEFKLGPEDTSLLYANTNRSWPPNTIASKIIEDIVKDMGRILSPIDHLPELQAPVINGFSYNGPAQTGLNVFLQERGLGYGRWAGVISINRTDSAFADLDSNQLKAAHASEELISKETGMIGRPVRKESFKEENEMEVTTRLRPGLFPSRRIRLESDTLSGRFVITAVKHKGDSWSGDYYTSMSAFGLQQPTIRGDELNAPSLRVVQEPEILFIDPTGGAGSISSQFGVPRKKTETNTDGYHRGLDIKAEAGTPILAAGDGIVEIASDTGAPYRSYGVWVQIRHIISDDLYYLTRYAHMLEGSLQVDVGDTVSSGQRIGDMGTTGYSSGPHLHFEILRNSTTDRINPQPFIGR